MAVSNIITKISLNNMWQQVDLSADNTEESFEWEL